ncbi:MAG: NADH-quinone oxidoreductase subunit C [Nitrospirota bacterium]|nr:NADH-quinone oxidoreductase subunit C [Nitrospirota bacterium]
MAQEKLQNLISAKLGASVRSMEAMKNNDLMVVLDLKDFIASLGTLKNDPALGFSTLMNHLGVDYGDRMAVIYNLYSQVHRAKITVRVFLDRKQPEIPSLERAFPGIGWYERETFDLLGIRFTGHSNMKRLLLPEDWEGYPLRKDYVYPTSYNGIETAREDLLDCGLSNAECGVSETIEHITTLNPKSAIRNPK